MENNIFLNGKLYFLEWKTPPIGGGGDTLARTDIFQ